jgi:hypothetical protein
MSVSQAAQAAAASAPASPLLLPLLLSFLSVLLLAEVLVGQSFSRTRPHACKSNVLGMRAK